MSAVNRDLDVEQGATFRLGFTWSAIDGLDSAGQPIPGAPYDLTGCTARMQIRQSFGTPVLVSVKDGDGITLGGPTGTVTVEISDERTDVLDGLRSARYDLEVEFPSGDVYRLLQGAVAISPNITRDVQ